MLKREERERRLRHVQRSQEQKSNKQVGSKGSVLLSFKSYESDAINKIKIFEI